MPSKSPLPRRVAFHSLGCRLNQSETTILRERFEAAGYAAVPFGEPADVGVINTCTVTREADAKSRKIVRGFIRQNPEAFVAVIGCYSQMGANSLAEIPGIDLIIGNQEKLNVLAYAEQGKNTEPLIIRDHIERDDFTIDTVGAGAATRRANLKIQDGCDFMCAFCVIPFARGRARSRELENLLDEARGLVTRGTKELILTGVNIGTYAWQGYTIIDIIDRLAAIPDLQRIRISSIEPTTIPEALLERMADPLHPLTPYLHIPLQSGSDHVLQLMKRRYTRADFLNFIDLAAARVPDICIGTDLLVGMPGETGANVDETCSALADSPIVYAHVFKYSERPGTASARYPGEVAPDEKNRRSARVRRISAEKLRRFQEARLGETHEVLFEQADAGYWTGYTANYLRVAVRSNAILENCILPVTLREVRGDMLVGQLALEELAATKTAAIAS